METYSLDDFYNIFKNGLPYVVPDEIFQLLNTLDSKITPIVSEKNDKKNEMVKKRRPTKQDNWEDVRTPFKTTTIIEEKTEGVEKWIQDIRTSLNKLSTKNYETHKTTIFECLEKCETFEGSTEKEKVDNFKTIALSIFTIASTNKFYAEIYAQLYKELINKYRTFEDILINHTSNFSNSVKDIQYSSPDDDYEKYCLYNKANDMRKASAVFFTCLMKNGTLPVLRILNIMVSFQTQILQDIDQESKINEVDEMTEILFLFLQEGKEMYQECKGEWIWKFVIKSNVETISKFTRKEKKGLSSRAIFKFMDMLKIVQSE